MIHRKIIFDYGQNKVLNNGWNFSDANSLGKSNREINIGSRNSSAFCLPARRKKKKKKKKKKKELKALVTYLAF